MVKVMLLDHTLPMEQAVASVTIDKASTTLANTLYLALGMLYMTQRLPIPIEVQLSISVSIGLILVGLIIFMAIQRYGVLTRLVRNLERFGFAQKRLKWLNRYLIPLDNQLMAYYTRYPWRFVNSVWLHFTAYAFDTVKIYILLRLLLGSNAPPFNEAVMVAVAVSALDQIFFFVPGLIGTFEGGRFMVLSALGVAQVHGLAFVIIARIEQLTWSGLGFIAYALCTRLALLSPARQESKVVGSS